jgi:nucleotide-binding universal stress UspA family protein
MTNGMLVPIDFSGVTDAVLAEAVRLARALNYKVWLMHVAEVEGMNISIEGLPANTREQAAKDLHVQHHKMDEYQKAIACEGLDVTATLVEGQPAEKILEKADRLKPELIVVGSHGHGALYHLVMGSVCESLIRQSPCPVVVVNGKPTLGQDKK